MTNVRGPLNSADPLTSILVGGVYNASAPAPADTQPCALQLDSEGNLLVNVAVGGGGGGGTVKIEDTSGNALNSNGTGALNVAVVSGGGSNPSVGTTGTTAPTSATEIGIISGGNLVGVSSTNPIPTSLPTGQAVELLDSGGTNKATISAAGALKVDGSASTQPVSGTVSLSVGQAVELLDSGGTNKASISAGGAVKVDASATTQPVSIASGQVASGAIASGAIASGAIASGAIAAGAASTSSGGAFPDGSVFVRSNSAATFPVNANIAASQTIAVTNIGTFAVQTAADGSASGGATGTKSLDVGGIYNNVVPTLTTGQQASVQLDASGNLKTQIPGSFVVPTVVQTAGGVTLSSLTSFAQAFATNNTKGNTIIVVFAYGGIAATLPTDSAGNTYTLLVSNTSVNVYAAYNIAGGANTVTGHANSGGIAMQIYEIANAGRIIDGTLSSTGTAASTTGSFSPVSVPNSLAIVGCAAGSASTITPPALYTNNSGTLTTLGSGVGPMIVCSVPLSGFNTSLNSPVFSLTGGVTWYVSGINILPIVVPIEGTVVANTNADGSISGGTAGTKSLDIGGIYNNTLPAPTNGQQVSVQMDPFANLRVHNAGGFSVPAIVQKANNVSPGTASSLSQAFTNNNTKGSTIVVVFAYGGLTPTVTDSQGNSYKSVVSSGGTVNIFVAYNVNAGANTVTTHLVTPGAIAMEIYELVHVGSVNVADGTIATNGSAASTTGTFSPISVPNSLAIVGCATIAAGTLTSPPGYTNDSGTLSPVGTGLTTVVVASTPLANFTNSTLISPVFAIGSGASWVVAGITVLPIVVPVEGSVTALTQFNSTAPALVTGQYSAAQADSTGSLYVNTEGRKTTYSAFASFTAVAGDIAVLPGSASKTIRVTRVEVSFVTTGTAAIETVQLVKRSAADSGGTSAAMTAVPHDSAFAAASAAPLSYTVAPTPGAAVGTVRGVQFNDASSALPGANTWIWDFGTRPGASIVLRGVAQELCVSLPTAISTQTAQVSFEWTEE